jgi:uncharacterized protein YabN with tetrapyrrole methylase and pyrophosphatase domain
MSAHQLTIVGSGIKFMSHLTHEARAHIEKAEKVLYLVNEPLMQEWINNNCKNAESLDDLYIRNPLRNDNYKLIATYILEKLNKTKLLCVVFYGHPTVFVQPTLYAVAMAREQGYKVLILPGISAEDCLFADLMIDPGTRGCQSFEATDFLLYRREYDSSSHLILWQPFVIGVLGIPQNHDPKKGLQLLTYYLKEKYSLDHEIILYEAAQYPGFSPSIKSIKLKSLPEEKISSLTTLYVKPAKIKQADVSMLKLLKET